MTRLHHKTGNTRHKQRNMSGSMVAIMAGGILIAVFTVGVLSLDIAHNVTTRTALQNAADAAALAGATVLVSNNVQSTVDGGVIEQVKQTAIDRAGTNNADGHPVTTAAGFTLNPKGLPYVIPPNAPGASGVSDNNGQCQVGADVEITNMFAGIIGHPTDRITVQSVATAYTSVTGVNQNTLFPIAVSLDTQAGHDPLDDQNKPLNLCKLGDHVIFYLKEPCANAAWTTYNTGKDSGNTVAEVNANAVKYINKALDSVLGTSYVEGLIPAQSVGQDSASGGKGINGGINLLGDISGTKDLTKLLKDKTIVLPIVAGDLPFWSLDKNGDGSQHAPGAGQTRPILGFCAIKVKRVINSTADNSLEMIEGTLVKALVKGTVGQANPKVDATPDPAHNLQAQDIAALGELSPGLVQLGATNLMAVTTPQQDLSLFYHDHKPAGANTLDSDGTNKPKPIDPALAKMIKDDLATIPANEGFNFAKPPDVEGAIAVIPSTDQNTDPVDTILHNPDVDLVIRAYFADEVDLNPGYDIRNGGNKQPIVIKSPMNPLNAPRYKVVDADGTVVQDWAPMVIGKKFNDPKLGTTYPLTIQIPGKSLPEGEHLVMIHTFDLDLGHGGYQTPPDDVSLLKQGDAAYYYLDLQNPSCPDL